MPADILIRNAIDADLEFIAESIVCAEKGMGDTNSYCKLFNINEDKFRSKLKEILVAGIANFEFSLANFKVAVANGLPVGAYGAWIEGADGIASGLLKISALKSFLGKESMTFYKMNGSIVEEMAIRRQIGTLQFESIYILEHFRGKGIGNMLVQALIDEAKENEPNLNIAQVQIIKQNSISLQAHLNYGFKIMEEKTASNPEAYSFFNGNTRLMLEKNI
jgi:GNAT superfamily N-acetyltransferase